MQGQAHSWHKRCENVSKFVYPVGKGCNVHGPSHEYQYDTNLLFRRQWKFHYGRHRYTEYIDIAGKVHNAKGFVGGDYSDDVGKDGKEHQGGVRADTNGHPNVNQVSGDFIGSKNAEV